MIKEWIFQKYLRKLFLRTIRLLKKNIKIKIPIMAKFSVPTGAAFFNTKNRILSIIKQKKNIGKIVNFLKMILNL